MERLLISQLLKWKDSQGRKPLIQEGARQVGSHQSLAIREKQQFKNHQHPPLYALCSSQRIKGRKLVFQRKRQFLTKLPLSLVFHKQKYIKTAYL